MSVQVNIRLPNELTERLDAIAKALGLTRSALIRIAVLEYVTSHAHIDAGKGEPPDPES